MKNNQKIKRHAKFTRVISVVTLAICSLFLILYINKNRMFTNESSKNVDGQNIVSKDTETNKVNENSNKNTQNKTSKKSSGTDDIDKLDNAPENYDCMRASADGDYKTENGFILNIKNGVASIDGNVIANKTYSLPDSYKASNPVNVSFNGFGRDGSYGGLENYVYAAFLSMQSDAAAAGLNLTPTSCYRCYAAQEQIYNNCVDSYGKEETDSFASRPGCSEHQTGLAIDLNSIDSSFDSTAECTWVHANCYKYGFVLRFPAGEESYTGYEYESWHIRYVGKKLAKKLYNNGNWISLERYYGITSKY